MVKLNLEDILAYLQSKKLDFQPQPDTKQLYFVHKVQDFEFPIFLRIYEGSPLLQLLVFIPSEMREPARNDTARLLHLLNKEIDIPGFGMDEQMGLVYYRCMLPSANQEIDGAIIETFIRSIQRICENLAPVVMAVASGSVTFEQALEKAKEHNVDGQNVEEPI